MIFKTLSPAADLHGEISLRQILSYTEELRRETEAKLTAIENTLTIIKKQLTAVREVIQ